MAEPPTLFTTERLRIRRIDAADAPMMYAVYSDPVAARFVDDGLPIKREEVGAWIAKTQDNYVHFGYGMMAIEWRETGEDIGFIGLVHPGGQPEAELKYALLRSWWGQGIATEAALGAMDYGRDALGLKELIATVDPEHLASQRVLAKAGFALREDRPNEDGSVTRVMEWNA